MGSRIRTEQDFPEKFWIHQAFPLKRRETLCEGDAGDSPTSVAEHSVEEERVTEFTLDVTGRGEVAGEERLGEKELRRADVVASEGEKVPTALQEGRSPEGFTMPVKRS